MTAPLVVVSEGAFKEAPSLRRPLNDALKEIQDSIVDAPVQIYRVAPMDVDVTSNTPGAGPWPLQLHQVPGAIFGVLVLRAENLTTVTQIPTTAVSVTQWASDGDTVTVGYVTGLTTNETYRLTFGLLYA